MEYRLEIELRIKEGRAHTVPDLIEDLVEVFEEVHPEVGAVGSWDRVAASFGLTIALDAEEAFSAANSAALILIDGLNAADVRPRPLPIRVNVYPAGRGAGAGEVT